MADYRKRLGNLATSPAVPYSIPFSSLLADWWCTVARNIRRMPDPRCQLAAQELTYASFGLSSASGIEKLNRDTEGPVLAGGRRDLRCAAGKHTREIDRRILALGV